MKTGFPRLNYGYIGRSMQVSNEADSTNPTGGKTMKKIMVILIILSTLILAGVLYGTSSLNVDEEGAVSLQQAYMAQYPETMPDIMFEPMAANIPF